MCAVYSLEKRDGPGTLVETIKSTGMPFIMLAWKGG
jgi:hypothetical protein